MTCDSEACGWRTRGGQRGPPRPAPRAFHSDKTGGEEKNLKPFPKKTGFQHPFSGAELTRTKRHSRDRLTLIVISRLNEAE